MTSPAATSVTHSPTAFVFPGSAVRNRDRNVSFDFGSGSGGGGSTQTISSGGGSAGKRGISADAESVDTSAAVNGMLENPLLRRPHAPLAAIQTTNHTQFGPSSSLSSSPMLGFHTATTPANGGGGGGGTPTPRSILRNRKPMTARATTTAHSITATVPTTNMMSLMPQSDQETTKAKTSRLSSIVPPPKQSIYLDFDVSLSTPSLAYANSVKENLDVRTEQIATNAMAPYSYDNLPPSQTFGGTQTGSTWVLVYGFHTRQQLQEVVQRFSRFGDIVSRIGADGGDMSSSSSSSSAASSSLRGNWVALQYATLLQTTKALSHAHECLSDGGTYCGVKSLDSNDSILIHHAHRNSVSLFGADGTQTLSPGWNAGERNGAAMRSYAMERPLQEDDVLELPRKEHTLDDGAAAAFAADRRRPPGERPMCERITRFLLFMPN